MPRYAPNPLTKCNAEGRRQQSANFDSHLRIEEHKAIASFDSQLRREELAAMGQIQQAAAQAAPAADPWQEVQRIQAELSRIANDPNMSSAEKHRQTVPLQQALTQALSKAWQ